MPGASQSLQASDSHLTEGQKNPSGDDDDGNSSTQCAAPHPRGSSGVSDLSSLHPQSPELTCCLSVWLPVCLSDHKVI